MTNEPTTEVAVRESISGAAIVKAIPVPRQLQELGVRIGRDEESGMAVVYLPDELRAKVNLVNPVTSYTQADPNWTPGISLVTIDVANDTYNVNGKKGLSKQALETIARAAGVLYTRTSRVPKDELQEGELWAYRATIGLRRSDGTIDELTRERGFNREAEQGEIEDSVRGAFFWENGHKTDRKKYATEEAVEAECRKRWLNELRFGPAKTESKAINRALRAALSMPTALSAAQAAKPFLIIAYNFTPDYNDPEIKRALVAVGLNAQAAIYGGSTVSDEMPEHPGADIPAGALPAGGTPGGSLEDVDEADLRGSAADQESRESDETRGVDDEQAGRAATEEAQPPHVDPAGSSTEEPSLTDDEPEPTASRIPASVIDTAGATIARGDKTVAQVFELAAGGDAKANEWLLWAVRNLVANDDDQRRAQIELFGTARHPDLWAQLQPGEAE